MPEFGGIIIYEITSFDSKTEASTQKSEDGINFPKKFEMYTWNIGIYSVNCYHWEPLLHEFRFCTQFNAHTKYTILPKDQRTKEMLDLTN